jgi:hypothetical protein
VFISVGSRVRLAQIAEKFGRCADIWRGMALREAGKHRREQGMAFGRAALALVQPREARCRTVVLREVPSA